MKWPWLRGVVETFLLTVHPPILSAPHHQAATLDLKSKEEKDAELDKKIEALRRKNEALIRRYQVLFPALLPRSEFPSPPPLPPLSMAPHHPQVQSQLPRPGMPPTPPHHSIIQSHPGVFTVAPGLHSGSHRPYTQGGPG